MAVAVRSHLTSGASVRSPARRIHSAIADPSSTTAEAQHMHSLAPYIPLPFCRCRAGDRLGNGFPVFTEDVERQHRRRRRGEIIVVRRRIVRGGRRDSYYWGSGSEATRQAVALRFLLPKMARSPAPPPDRCKPPIRLPLNGNAAAGDWPAG